MDVLILHSSPNVEGLTASCAQAAAEGVAAGGGSAEVLRVTDLKIARCNQCGNGWGGCRPRHECFGVQDDFQPTHEKTRQADAYILVSPVYWGEMSESLKALTDRLRRCEAPCRDESCFFDKPIIGVAAAGGSGNGTITCLAQMDRWLNHVRARRFDLVGVNRWSAAYKLDAIRSAAQAMVELG